MTRSFWNWLAISTLWLSTIFTPFTNVTLASDWDHVVWDKDSWEITVYSDNFSITLQDKDLWANNVWETWNYYQYWNNQPWDNENENTKNIRSGYTTNTYRNNWWWWNDVFAIYEDSDYLNGYDNVNHIAINVLERRWPCPNGYHVPSAWEWNELIKIWCEQKEWCNAQSLTNWFYALNDGYWQSFIEEMHLVPGGFLYNKYYSKNVRNWPSYDVIENNAWDLSGNESTPRLCVFRSNNAIYAQLIDDVKGVTLASSSSLELKQKHNNIEAASAVGKDIAEKAKKAKIKTVVFDRGGYLYHGRVKALAEAARENGLEF